MVDSPPENREEKEQTRAKQDMTLPRPAEARLHFCWPLWSFVGLGRDPGATGTLGMALRASHLTEPQLTPGSSWCEKPYCCPRHRQKCLPGQSVQLDCRRAFSQSVLRDGWVSVYLPLDFFKKIFCFVRLVSLLILSRSSLITNLMWQIIMVKIISSNGLDN